MKIRWKIPIIIVVVLIVLGVAVKFALDSLFSYILIASLSGSQINLNDLESLIPDFDTTEVLPEFSEEKENHEQAKENPDNSGNSKDDTGETVTNSNIAVNEMNDKNKSSVESVKSNTNESKEKTNVSKDINKKNESEFTEAINDTDKNYDNFNSSSENDSKKEELKPDTSKDGNVKSPTDGDANKGDSAGNKNNVINKDVGNKASDNGGADNKENKNTSGDNSTKSGGKLNEGLDTNTGKDTKDNGEIVITTDKVKEVEKQVSKEDKNKALSILLSKLGPSDFKRLFDIAFSKSTIDEKISQAKQVLRDKITEDDKETLKFLFNKYEHLVDELK